jgi:hypothetical protein
MIRHRDKLLARRQRVVFELRVPDERGHQSLMREAIRA